MEQGALIYSQRKDGDLIQDWETSPYLEKLSPICWKELITTKAL